MTNPASRPITTGKTSSAGGPQYTYRGAVIGSNAKGTVFSFRLEGFPHGPNGYWGGLGHIDVAVDLIDSWMDHRKLPPPYVTPKEAT